MKMCAKIIGCVLLLALITSTVFAQATPGGGSAQFTQFREQHKYTFQLMQMVRHIEGIERDSKHALTSSQAKKVVAVLKPLQTKPKLTQEQAKQALKSLKPIFTVSQLNAMAKIKEPPRFRPGQAPAGGPPGGFRRPGGAGGNRPPRMNPAQMKDFNPFYSKVDSKAPGGAERVKRMSDFIKRLEAKGRGVKVAPPKPPAKPVKAKK